MAAEGKTGRQHLYWAVWAVALCVAVVMTALASQGVFLPGDATIARAIQEARALDAALGPVSEVFYRAGVSPWWPLLTIAIAGVMWLRGLRMTAAFMLLTGLLRGVNGLLKEIVSRPRPSPEDLPYVDPTVGLSFPSGHTFGIVLAAGFIAYVVLQREQRAWAQRLTLAIAGALMLLMGLQRVYQGQHWPTDVLAGWLWGGIVLFLVLKVYRRERGSTSPTDALSDFGEGERSV